MTPEELVILGVSDDELPKNANVFSFDIERCNAPISTGDSWQHLLQGHLYFDHVIKQLPINALENPDAINASRLGFSQKLLLVLALGLFPIGTMSVVEHINSLRNKIAHDLDFEITDKEVLDLSNCTPKYLREAAVIDKNGELGSIRFHELLFVVLMQVEQNRKIKPSTGCRSNEKSLRCEDICKIFGWRPNALLPLRTFFGSIIKKFLPLTQNPDVKYWGTLPHRDVVPAFIYDKVSYHTWHPA